MTAKKRPAARPRPLLRATFRVLGPVLPGATSAIAGALFRMAPRHRTSEREAEALASGRRADLVTRRGRVAVWTWGQGAPVLLIHGWGSRGSRLSSFVPALLGAGFSAVAFDAPGHGESSGRLSSMPQFVEAVGAIADRFGRMEGIVAHSLGGAVAAIAISRGVSARRAVFVAPSARPDRYTRQFAEALDIAEPLRRRMEMRLEEKLRFQWSDLDVLAAARSATTPLLVFHDREDADVPWSDGAAIVEAWRGSRLISTSGLGHRRIVHDAHVVTEAVNFLKDS